MFPAFYVLFIDKIDCIHWGLSLHKYFKIRNSLSCHFNSRIFFSFFTQQCRWQLKKKTIKNALMWSVHHINSCTRTPCLTLVCARRGHLVVVLGQEEFLQDGIWTQSIHIVAEVPLQSTNLNYIIYTENTQVSRETWHLKSEASGSRAWAALLSALPWGIQP